MRLLIPEFFFILEICFFYPWKSPKFLKIPEFREKWKHWDDNKYSKNYSLMRSSLHLITRLTEFPLLAGIRMNTRPSTVHADVTFSCPCAFRSSSRFFDVRSSCRVMLVPFSLRRFWSFWRFLQVSYTGGVIQSQSTCFMEKKKVWLLNQWKKYTGLRAISPPKSKKSHRKSKKNPRKSP